nr:AraC family transcriptional regulator [uncultured Cardiobacterium sp.]
MSTDYHRRLQPVIRYLEQHYRDPPDLTTIAALASLSPYHFHRIFTAVTGETLAAYLRRLRWITAPASSITTASGRSPMPPISASTQPSCCKPVRGGASRPVYWRRCVSLALSHRSLP